MNGDGKILFRSLWAADRAAMHHALSEVAAGRTPEKNQSQALIGPVVRAMGQVQEVMERAGPQAIRELWLAGLPMALAGRIATFFPWLTPDQRGITAVLTLTIIMIVGVVVLVVWALA